MLFLCSVLLLITCGVHTVTCTIIQLSSFSGTLTCPAFSYLTWHPLPFVCHVNSSSTCNFHFSLLSLATSATDLHCATESDSSVIPNALFVRGRGCMTEHDVTIYEALWLNVMVMIILHTVYVLILIIGMVYMVIKWSPCYKWFRISMCILMRAMSFCTITPCT